MRISELVTNQHRARKAVIYVRQSTPQQVISNQESLAMQRALKGRARELGWTPEDIHLVEDDLGLSGTSTEHRQGFKNMVTQVALGEVGILLCFDVSRLIRNCSDLYPVLDVCGYKDCLIGDRDGVYHPGSINGRLLLGLKGQLAEIELSTIRARLRAGIRNKAKRGEFKMVLPAGFIRYEAGEVQKDPNVEVQHRIDLVFEMFLKLRAAAKVVRFLNEHELLMPRRGYDGEICWRRASTSTVLCILKNPAYAGTYVFGRYETVRSGPSPTETIRRALPIDQWKIVIHNKYPAYVDWETFVKIQAMLKDNYAEYDKHKTRGVPRQGSALLHGLVYCGECGHKMIVTYKPHSRYQCNHLRRHYGEKTCQYIPTETVDNYVVNAFFEALSPVELNAYQKALATRRTDEQKVHHALNQQLERLRYQARLAERQYNQVDPENRLIAAELERRWEQALRELKTAEEEYQKRTTVVPLPSIPPELKQAFSDLGKNLPHIWHNSLLNHQQQKAFLRCLIDKVVMHRIAADRLHIRIVWKGHDTTTSQISLPVNSFRELPQAEQFEERVKELYHHGKTDQEIARTLTEEGFHSPARDAVITSTVRNVRVNLGLRKKQAFHHARIPDGFLSVSQLARLLNVHKNWIYNAIANGRVSVDKNQDTNMYLFPNTPDTLNKFQQLRNQTLQCIAF